ncbi:MAG: HAD family hydrolase [Chloroflexi bacterium]|nr:HAD family hydrolase [Chloroflexota bacterium]
MEQRKSLQPVRAVFFDLYNTLARFWPPREELQAAACREFGIGVSAQGITRGYAVADEFMARENARYPLRRRTPQESAEFFGEYERLILQGAGVPVERELAGRIMQRVRQFPYDLALFDDVLPALRELKQQGLVLGLISNVNRDGRQLGDSLGLTPCLDFVVTSQEVASEKPHQPIFLKALERAGVSPGDAAHVGDQYTSDVLGARQVGIQGVLMDRYRMLSQPVDCPVVHSMPELAELVRTGR